MIREADKIFANRLGFVLEYWRDLGKVCIVRCDRFVASKINFGMNRGKVLKRMRESGWEVIEEYSAVYIMMKLVSGKDDVDECD